MVRVVSHVPDGHILEQSAIYFMDVVCTGLELLYVPLHAPCAHILQSQLTLWEEI